MYLFQIFIALFHLQILYFYFILIKTYIIKAYLMNYTIIIINHKNNFKYINELYILSKAFILI